MRLRNFLIAAVLSSASLAAHADTIFNLSNVTLQGGGTLTGTITVNSTFTGITAVNIVASADGSFPGQTYNLSNSTLSDAQFPYNFRLDDSTLGSQLQFNFLNTNPLTAGGAPILSSNSYDHEAAGGNRSILGGSLVPASIAVTPEPSSLILLGTGLLGMVGIARRRFV